MSSPRSLVSTAEAAAAVGIHPRTLIRYAANGLVTPAATLPGPSGKRMHYRWALDGPDGLRAQLRELGRRRDED